MWAGCNVRQKPARMWRLWTFIWGAKSQEVLQEIRAPQKTARMGYSSLSIQLFQKHFYIISKPVLGCIHVFPTSLLKPENFLKAQVSIPIQKQGGVSLEALGSVPNDWHRYLLFKLIPWVCFANLDCHRGWRFFWGNGRKAWTALSSTGYPDVSSSCGSLPPVIQDFRVPWFLSVGCNQREPRVRFKLSGGCVWRHALSLAQVNQRHAAAKSDAQPSLGPLSKRSCGVPLM